MARGLPEDVLATLSSSRHMVVVGTAPMGRIAEVFDGDISRRVVEHAKGLVAVVPVD